MRNAAIALALLALAAPAGASVFTVTKTADTLDGACAPYDCSLREAVAAANLAFGTDVIELPPGNYVLTRTGAGENNAETGDLDVRDPLILVGTDAGTTILDGNATDRVLDVSAETEIFGVTVRNGLSNGVGGGILVRRTQLNYFVVIRRSVISGNHAFGSDGGGVLSESRGPVVVLESTVSGNRADGNGGGLMASSFWVIDSTVSGNSAGQLGGGLYYFEDTSPPIWGSTITANQAGREGGGIYVERVPWVVAEGDSIQGSIVAGNTAPANPDCIRAFSVGYNVIGIADGCGNNNLDRKGNQIAPLDPKLAPLAGIGGPTPVHALLPGSPALDFVPAASCTPADQIGQTRSVACEAGAVEQPLQPICVPGGPVLCLKDGRFRVTSSWASPNGTGGPATAAPLTDDTGNFWFFSPQNLELTVKIIDGCTVNDRFWVFTSGLTDRAVDLRLEDLWSGAAWTHRHPSGSTYATRLDTSALDVCHLPSVPAESGDPGTMAVDPVSSVYAVTLGFDTLDGACDHHCSLREAVAVSNLRPGLEVILLGDRVHTLTRAGRTEDENATGDLDVLGPLAILGAGARRSIVDGGAVDRIFQASAAHSRLEIHGVTLRNGRAEGHLGGAVFGDLVLVASHVTGNSAATGGGINSFNLIIRDSTVSDNEALNGGGIESYGVLRLSNVTVSGNRAAETGGGISLFAFDQEVDGATITGNSAGLYGGGVSAIFETCPSSDLGCRTDFVIRRSLVAGNQAPKFRDCANLDPTVNSYNVFGIDEPFGCNPGSTDLAGTPAKPLDPKLTPLGDHGGPTPTHSLLADSPAIDFVPVAGCLARDQRGRTRPGTPEDTRCDAGAVERLPACQPDATTLCLGEGDRFRVTAHWAARGEAGEARSIPLTLDTGSFWFFSPANVELTLKILDGCAVNDRFWIFVSGLTDVAVDILVEDFATGKSWAYHHAAGTPFQPRLDTDALDICEEGS